MLLPLKDDTPLKRIPFQYVTVALIAACVGVFLWQLSLGEAGGRRAVLGLGVVPAVLVGDRALPAGLAVVPTEWTLVTSMFLHGGWMHLIGNMLFLWIFGDNVEDALGHPRFIAFYLLTGLAAAVAHVVADPASTVPTIGASGAISGVLGAYLVLHPRASVLVLVVRIVMHLPAFVVLGLWIGLQVVNALASAGGTGGGVAWWAHIGGFVAGLILVVPMRQKGVPLFDRVAPGGVHPAAHIGRRRGSVPDSGRGWRR